MKLTIRETTKADNETIYLIEKHAFGEVDERAALWDGHYEMLTTSH